MRQGESRVPDRVGEDDEDDDEDLEGFEDAKNH
jgi:hypothetical protein